MSFYEMSFSDYIKENVEDNDTLSQMNDKRIAMELVNCYWRLKSTYDMNSMDMSDDLKDCLEGDMGNFQHFIAVLVNKKFPGGVVI